MLSERQKNLLDSIIREHIKTAEPVGSESSIFGGFKISPATIRNEMKDLEDAGFLSHPHTSAGRIPTEKGYRFFIENLLKEYCPGNAERSALKQKKEDFEEAMKQKAKTLSGLTSEAIIATFGSASLYYTGLAHLFSKPEFREMEMVVSFSEILDKLDEAVCDLFKKDFKGIKILIGSENPFDKRCGIIIGKYTTESQEGLCGILGPVRMDYERDASLLKYLIDSL